MRCAEHAGGILDSCSDFSLIKHDIPEQSHSISGNGNLDVFTCASSSAPFRLLFESWLRDGCFWGEHLCFWSLRKGQWRLYECNDLHLPLSPGVLALQWVTRTVHQPQLTFYLIFGQVSAAEHLAVSLRPRKVVISSWEPREKESVISFLLGAERGHPNTSMASQGYLLFNTSGLK